MCSPQSAEQVASWINRHLPDGPKPGIQRPLNYVKMITITTTMLGIVSLTSVAWPYMLPVLQNRNLWAGMSLITILLFTSGHMFNHIRKVPYVAGDGKGGISYFAGGFSNQFGMETQIVAAMCKMQSSGTSLLTANHAVRWHSLLCHNSPSLEGSSNDRPQETAGGCLYLGWHNTWHVQLLAKCF